MQASYKVYELKQIVSTIVPKDITWNYISHQEHLCLIEISTGQRYIVDINDKKIHDTCAREDGTVSFEGTVHVFGKETEIHVYVPKYVGVQLTHRIMEILGLNTAKGWYIIDQVESLCLLHYEDDADMNVVGHLRGTLVDVDAGVKVAESFGYTPNVKVIEHIMPTPHDDVELYDEYGKLHMFTKDKMVLKRAYEGTGLRVVLYKGEVFKLTHKKIRPMKSRWGTGGYFTNLFKQNGGPKDAELFDMSKKYSPWCYSFMIVDPSLLLATKQNVMHGYVVFLNLSKMWDNDNCPFDKEEVEVQPTAKFNVVAEVGASVNQPCITIPSNLTLQEANCHLADGYYGPIKTNDIRTKLGESVMIYQMDEQGKVLDIMKVSSLSYDYRLTLRGNDSYPYHRFFKLVQDSYQTVEYFPNYKKFMEKYVVYINYDKEFLMKAKNDIKILSLCTGTMTDEQKKDRGYLLNMIWINYIAALPVPLQEEAFDYLEKMLSERTALISWLENKVVHDYDATLLSKRANQIITTAKMNGKQAKQTGKTDNEETYAKEVVRNFIHREYGDSLYSLIKEMKDVKKKKQTIQ